MAFKRKNPAELQAQLKELNGGNNSYSEDKKDEWRCVRDSSGNGKAIIRFLPGATEDDLPFVKLVNHSFKKAGWYINNCSSTHGDYESCPVCKYMSDNDSYNTNNTEYKLLSRKIGYWANILVIKDPATPENEGKVFKWRFGKKIWDKINAQVEVDTDMGETPVDVTCVFEGANFNLKIKEVGGFANYDESSFGSPGPIANIDDEDYQEKLLASLHDISDKVTKDKFESFDKLQEKFKKVFLDTKGSAATKKAEKDIDDFDKQLDEYSSDSKPKETAKPKQTQKKKDEDDDFDDIFDGL